LHAVADGDGLSAYATQVITLTIHAPTQAGEAVLEMQVRAERALVTLDHAALDHLHRVISAARERCGCGGVSSAEPRP
jgi:hypothetical protein